MFDRIYEWMSYYSDEITWFLIGSLVTDGINELIKYNFEYGVFCIVVSSGLWYLYIKDLKDKE